jgi:putative DNA primase/helicase
MTGTAAGKRPYLDEWQNRPRETLQQVQQWASEGNVGLRTGSPSGVIVIDVDAYKEGFDDHAFAALNLPATATAVTGRGGFHYYYRYVKIPNTDGKLGKHVETKCDGRQVVFPGSVSCETGKLYEWLEGHEPWNIALAELPPHIIDLLAKPDRPMPMNQSQQAPQPVSQPANSAQIAKYVRMAVKFESNQVAKATVGERNDQLNSSAFSLGTLVGAGLLERQAAEDSLMQAATDCGLVEDDGETPARKTITSGMEAGIQHPRQIPARVPTLAKETADDDSERALNKLGAARGDIVVKSKNPVPLAKSFIREVCADRGGKVLLRRYRGQFFLFDRTSYREFSDEQVDAAIYRFVGRVVEEHVIEESGEVSKIRIKVRQSIVREIRLALPSCGEVLLNDYSDAPCWLGDNRGRPDPRHIAAFRNGFLDMASGKFYPPDSDLFVTAASDFDYAADVSDPARFLAFLNSIWGDDAESIGLLQEWIGYNLGADTRQQKILLIVGPKRSGKGTIARVMANLLGPDNCCAPTLASLSQNFGLQAVVGKRAAFISDARLSSRADQAVIAERLLSISGEDRITIDRKYLTPWTGRVGARFTIFTNELPRLGDASGALSSRFLLLKMVNSFYGREDHALTDTLLAELPGIFHWAWKGWLRLRERGRFVMPAAAAEAVQELEDLTSPVAAFVREECMIGTECWIECETLWKRWCAWCEAQGRTYPGNQATFGRDLSAAIPTLRRSRLQREDGARFYAYMGIQ